MICLTTTGSTRQSDDGIDGQSRYQHPVGLSFQHADIAYSRRALEAEVTLGIEPIAPTRKRGEAAQPHQFPKTELPAIDEYATGTARGIRLQSTAEVQSSLVASRRAASLPAPGAAAPVVPVSAVLQSLCAGPVQLPQTVLTQALRVD